MLIARRSSAGLSIQRNFAWNLLGETSFSLAQWLLLVFLARLESPTVVGEFALALALTAPVYLLVGLNLRVVQATDASGRWLFEDYMRLRYILSGVAFTICIFLALAFGLTGEEFAVVAVIAAAKATEASSQTFYGYFQRRERLDLVARSLILRAGLSTATFASLLALFPGLLPATVGMWAGWLVTEVAHDRRIGKAMWRQEKRDVRARTQSSRGRHPWLSLARTALPLGVSAGVASLTLNVPRYLVVGLVGPAALGVYAALAYLAQVIGMVTGAMGNAVVPRLAQYHRDGRVEAFVRLVVLLTGLGVAATAVSLVVLAFAGEWVIGTLVGDEFVDQPLLLALVVGVGLATVQRSLGRGLQAAHRFVAFLGADVLTLLVVVVIGPRLVRSHGVDGAAWSLNIALATAVIVTIVLLAQTTVRMRSKRPSAAT